MLLLKKFHLIGSDCLKKVAVIQDMSSFGKCSLTAAIPVLSVMGVQACPLPTAVFSAQTAYPSFHHQDLTANMPHFMNEWARNGETFDGIFSGFVTGDAQIQHIFRFLELFQKPETTVLVDPVMGDDGELYKMYTPALLDKMKELVRHATITTPNITECCLLTGTSYEKLVQYEGLDFDKALIETAQKLQLQTNAKIVVTGIRRNEQTICNLYADEATAYVSESPYNGSSFSGTGDLFSSVVIGSVMQGFTVADGMKRAEQFLCAAIEETVRAKTKAIEGIHFERYLSMLIREES